MYTDDVVQRRPLVDGSVLSSRFIRGLVLAVAMGAALIGTAQPLDAQNRPDDRAWYQRLVDGTAEFVYWAAWPTARYQNVVFKDIDFVSPGAVVTFRLHGKSAFTDGDLWVDVKVGMRSTGELTSLEWGDYNGFFPPGFTLRTAGQALAEINKQKGMTASPSGSMPPSRATAESPTASASPSALTVVCLSNSTANLVSYSMKWGSKTEELRLEAGGSWRFWAPADAGAFDITFDGDLTSTNNPRSFKLTGVTRTTAPTSCSDDLTIDFVASGSRLGVQPRTWSTGSAHPFIFNVVASATQGSWSCASGFKWAAPEDRTSLDCVDARYGYVGVSIAVDSNQSFPRIAGVVAGGMAAQAGIVTGLYIISIDGISTEGLTLDAVAAKVRGEVGKTVRLGVAGVGGPPRVVVVTRR